MSRKLVLLASLVFFLVGMLLSRAYIAAKDRELNEAKTKLLNRYGTMEALAFKRDTPGGTVLSADDLKSVMVPKLGLKGQALSKENLNEILGRKTVIAHRANEVVFWSDIEGGDLSARGLSASVKRQMRAISVNCTGAAAVSGMIKPNDHVDVIGTFNFPGVDGTLKKGDLVTSTLLQNVLVLATGRETSNDQTRNLGLTQGYATVTLEVTPREAEMLAFTEQMKGRLVLTLRNRNDTSYEKELPKVDFDKIRSEIEELNLKRQQSLGGM